MDILFYSNNCQHSVKLLSILNVNNTLKNYETICIDNHKRSELPSFLKKVPTIYNKTTKNIYTDNDLFHYIEKTDNVESFMNETNYSFIDVPERIMPAETSHEPIVDLDRYIEMRNKDYNTIKETIKRNNPNL